MPRKKPTCNKCGQDHYGFQPCEIAKRHKPAPITVRQPLPEGIKPWGDSLTTLKRQGTTFFNREMPARETGRLTYPPKE